MDVTKLKVHRIADETVFGIVDDFFNLDLDDVDSEEMRENIDYSAFPYHARALCLYAILLITRRHETNAADFDAYYDERLNDARVCLSQRPEYANLTDEELDDVAKEITLHDIRNCFAHGSFGISYGFGTKKLSFVLYPNQSKIVSQYPIVISADKITKSIQNYLGDISYKYQRILENDQFDPSVNIDEPFREIMFPVQISKLADYYYDKYKNPKQNVLFSGDIYRFIHYALLSAKITYEQDEYYNIFGRDSYVFNTISLIRNSLAHGQTKYTDTGNTVTYQDKRRQTTEDFGVSGAKLYLLDEQKRVITKMLNRQIPPSQSALDSLKNAFKQIYDYFFNSGYTLDDFAAEFEGIDQDHPTTETKR